MARVGRLKMHIVCSKRTVSEGAPIQTATSLRRCGDGGANNLRHCEGAPIQSATVYRRRTEYLKTFFISLRRRYEVGIRRRYEVGIRRRYKVGIRRQYEVGIRRRYEVGSEFVSNSLSELNNQLISQTNRERIRTDPICEFSATVDRIL